MAVVFVFTDAEVVRAKELSVNHIRLPDESEESLLKWMDDPMTKIWMPFLSDDNERKELISNFHNQIIMRKIWRD